MNSDEHSRHDASRFSSEQIYLRPAFRQLFIPPRPSPNDRRPAHEHIDTLPPPRRDFPVSIPAAREKFRSFLTQKGLRVTNQRLAIFEAAFAQPEHFTAEQLVDFARAIDDSVSRATIYRTLPIMTESALLREVDIGSGEKFYRPNAGTPNAQVAQVVCVDCDKIFEISAPFMEWYGSTVSTKLGLTPISQRLQVSAHCDAFRRAGSCPRRT
jgi:Fe2+ or Zn2+ uptake regulation protein